MLLRSTAAPYPQALYTALHRLKEVVLITDDVLRIQYANRATERLLNMRLVSDSSDVPTNVQLWALMRFLYSHAPIHNRMK